MTLRKYLVLMSFATCLCWGAWLLVLFLVDPEGTSGAGFLMFYVALFFALMGTFAILGFLIRYVFKKDEFAFRQVKVSFRQAILLSMLVVGWLFLQAHGFLAWWNLLIFIAILAALEFFFVSQKNLVSVDADSWV